MTSDAIDGAGDASGSRDFGNTLLQILIFGAGDLGAAERQNLRDGGAAPHHIDGFEAQATSELNHHFPDRRTRSRLQQPLARSDVEFTRRQQHRSDWIDQSLRRRGDVETIGYRNHAGRICDHVLLPGTGDTDRDYPLTNSQVVNAFAKRIDKFLRIRVQERLGKVG